MPDGELTVSNTSPLLNLALVERLDLLRSQLDSISIPEAVRSELLAGDDARDRLRVFLESEFVSVEPTERDDLVVELRTELDAGEAAAIALAIERDADLVLLDERDGRQVARRHGLPVTGVVGIVLRAARRGMVDAEQALDELRDAGFWIGDDLYRRAIGEIAERDERE